MIVAISAINAEFHFSLAETIIRQNQSTFGCFFISANFLLLLKPVLRKLTFNENSLSGSRLLDESPAEFLLPVTPIDGVTI